MLGGRPCIACRHKGARKFGLVRNLITMPTRVKILIFPIADGTANMSGRDHGGVREPTPRRDQRVRNDDLSEDLQGNSELSQPVDETNNVFLSIEGDFIYRHHVEPPVQSTCRKKKHSQSH